MTTSPTDSARPTLADLRDLVRLATPVVLAQVGLMAMNVVDTMIVGRVSATALAGAAVGTVYVFAVGTFGMGILTSLDPIVSQSAGAGDDAAVTRALLRGLALAFVLGVVGALVTLPVEPVLRALGQPPELVAVAVPYVHVQGPAYFAFFATVAFRQTLQALRHMRPIVTMIVIANVVNALLAWALVFGHFGLPRLEALGAGLATTIARWLMAILLPVLAWRWLGPRLRWQPEVIRWRPIAHMLRIGLPIGFQYELEFGVFATVALIMGQLGPVPASAHQIAINIASLTFMVPLGVSSAGSILVGRAIGAGTPVVVRRAGLAALAAGAGFMAVSALVLIVAPRMLARAYTPDPAVLALASALIPIAGVFQIFDGIQVVSIGVLRGTGDTRTPLVVSLIGYWIVALPISLALGFSLGWGPKGLWWGLVAGLGVVAMILVARVKARLWGPIARLHVDEGH